MDATTLTAFTRDDFRNWLIKNHTVGKKAAVILYKRHTGKPAPTHRELMEEAICFGWIDTTIKRLDDNKYLRYFAKRNNNSKWSGNTLSYAKKLLDEGKMTSEGLKYYHLGLQKPTHDHGIPKNPDIPVALKKALAKNKIAKNNFEIFSPSTKRMFYRWILGAKLSETRKKRIAIVVKNAIKGKNDIF